jgi:hypothetical protein
MRYHWDPLDNTSVSSSFARACEGLMHVRVLCGEWDEVIWRVLVLLEFSETRAVRIDFQKVCTICAVELQSLACCAPREREG